MREIEYRLSDDRLAISWFNRSSDCMQSIIDLIDMMNNQYQFNIYNNDEDLEKELLEKKISIKYEVILSPFVYQIEKLLKSFLIMCEQYRDPDAFNRESVMRNINREIRSYSGGNNSHDLLNLINYIDSQRRSNFISRIANEYARIRDGEEFMHNPYSLRSTSGYSSPEDRIVAATEEYKQGFVQFRYLFEKTEELPFQPIDTEKVLEYGIAIRNIIGEEINQMVQYYGYASLFPFDYMDLPKSVSIKWWKH